VSAPKNSAIRVDTVSTILWRDIHSNENGASAYASVRHDRVFDGEGDHQPSPSHSCLEGICRASAKKGRKSEIAGLPNDSGWSNRGANIQEPMHVST
jgi:hypothetical protein